MNKEIELFALATMALYTHMADSWDSGDWRRSQLVIDYVRFLNDCRGKD